MYIIKHTPEYILCRNTKYNMVISPVIYAMTYHMQGTSVYTTKSVYMTDYV